MKERWVISDTHFGHAGICKFTHHDTGVKIRPWDDVEEMNEDMIRMWNEVVKPGDRVYHLGDVVMEKKYLPIMSRLNGKKVLMLGNHDCFSAKEYLKYFEDVRGYTIYEKVIMSHIPVHPDIKERWKMNIHGHLHTNAIDDPWYQNVSVEQIGFKPILLEEVMSRL